MKEYINYYYQIVVEDIRLTNGKYFFHDNKHRYRLEPVFLYNELLEEIYRLQIDLSGVSEFFHSIVKNKDGSLFTEIERKSYVLLRLSPVPEELISIYDLRQLWFRTFPLNNNFRNCLFPWGILWEKKIDFYEEQLVNNSNDLDLNLFFYFVGLGENAILYFKETLKNNSVDGLYLFPSHRRVNKNMNLIDFYDPINLVLDLRVRDIAEYIKDSFWNSSYDIVEIENFLIESSLSKIEAQLFFSRLLFPSFYFDCLEFNCFFDYMSERVEEYQAFITDIYHCLREQYSIEEIKWLKKKT